MYSRDYTKAAFFTFILYFFGYLPGLLVNLYNFADACEALLDGDDAPGIGCLAALLLVAGGGPLIAIALCYVLLSHFY